MERNIIVITTAATKRELQKISEVLVRKSLAACCQIVGPILSYYKWKNKLQTAREYICIIKTKEIQYKKIENTIKNIHTYELPEIIAFKIDRGLKEYLEWINSNS